MAYVGTADTPGCKVLGVIDRLPAMLKQQAPLPVKPPPTIR